MAAADQAVLLILYRRYRYSSFSMYTGPRTINKREPEWLYDGAKLRENHFRPEDSVKKKDEEARELRLFAKELRKGVRQQRVRDKTKEKAGTLPLVQRLIRCCWHERRIASLWCRTTWNSSDWNSSSSFCRGRCSCLKTQLEMLYWEPFF